MLGEDGCCVTLVGVAYFNIHVLLNTNTQVLGLSSHPLKSCHPVSGEKPEAANMNPSGNDMNPSGSDMNPSGSDMNPSGS
jgi:hypothetical protein